LSSPKPPLCKATLVTKILLKLAGFDMGEKCIRPTQPAEYE